METFKYTLLFCDKRDQKEVITLMAEEDRTKPSRVPIAQYEELQTNYNQLEKSTKKTINNNRAGSGIIGGGVGALLTYLLMHSCNGNYTTTKQNVSDCDKQVNPVQFQFQICDGTKTDSGNSHNSGKNKPTYDSKQCPEGKTCLDSGLEHKLKVCLDENEKLRKRPEHCPKPKYTPNQKECPPAPKCESSPYFRQGE